MQRYSIVMVSTLRLYLLRIAYLMISIFITTQIWPQLIGATRYPHMSGVARCLLSAMAPITLLGLRYPLKMLPILLFELFWKAAWLVAIGMPLWFANALDPSRHETFNDCRFGVILCLVVIPWRYVIDNYFAAAGDRWRTSSDVRAISNDSAA
jgi:hypothetical protein